MVGLAKASFLASVSLGNRIGRLIIKMAHVRRLFWNSRLGGTDIHNPAIYCQSEQERYKTTQSGLPAFLTKL